MNKKKRRNNNIRILILGIILGLIIGIIIGGIFVLKNRTCENLKEDYDWLKESSMDCWSKLRLLDTKCWDTSDCSRNPNLEGCYKRKDDCNWCCFNSCTLMYCPKDFYVSCNGLLDKGCTQW